MKIKHSIQRRLIAITAAGFVLAGSVVVADYATVNKLFGDAQYELCVAPLHGLSVRIPQGWKMSYYSRNHTYSIVPPQGIFFTNDTGVSIEMLGYFYPYDSSGFYSKYENHLDSTIHLFLEWRYTWLVETQTSYPYEQGDYIIAKASLETGKTVRREEDLWWRPLPKHESVDLYWIVSTVEGEIYAVNAAVAKSGIEDVDAQADEIIRSLQFGVNQMAFDPTVEERPQIQAEPVDCEL